MILVITSKLGCPRQGDLLPMMLFNVLTDMVVITITRAKEDGRVGNLIPHLVEDEVFILQCTDDTIYLCKMIYIKHST